MHPVQRFLIAYTLAFFSGLRGLSGWAGQRSGPAVWFILAYALVLALLSVLLPPWLLLALSAAVAIPSLTTMYMLVRCRLMRRR